MTYIQRWSRCTKACCLCHVRRNKRIEESNGPRLFDRERIPILTSSTLDRIRSELRSSKKESFFRLRPNLKLRIRNQDSQGTTSLIDSTKSNTSHFLLIKITSHAPIGLSLRVAGCGQDERWEVRTVHPLAIIKSWAIKFLNSFITFGTTKAVGHCTLTS